MNNFMKSVALGALLAHGPTAFAQDWHANFPSGNPINSTEWLGCDGTSTQPLRIKTVPDYAIDLYTSDIRRFSLLPDNTYATLGAYSSIVANGYSLHSPDVAAFLGSAPGPFSLEHLAAATNSTYQDAYRDWARTGTTYTGGGTMGYFGLKEDGKSNTDLVVQLAKREGQTAPDRIRFLFTDVLNGGSASGADSQEGLEGMRLTAVGNDEVNVGVGDFFAAGVGEPTERVDVVDGKVRIRQLPTDPQDDTLDKYMVVDNNGVVHWRPLPPVATTCEWTRNPGAKFALSGHLPPNTNGTCPDQAWRYGVGVASPTYKFQIEGDRTTSGSIGGLLTRFKGADTGWSYGSYTSLEPSQTTLDFAAASFGILSGVRTAGFGVLGRTVLNVAGVTATSVSGVTGDVFVDVGSSNLSCGVSGVAITRQSGTVNKNFGVKGESGGVAGSVNYSYGVHGRATMGSMGNFSVYGDSPGHGATDWAGYFPGRTHSPGGVWTTSDSNLKQNIEPLANATTRILALDPRTYYFDVAGHPHMGLPTELQHGFLAQNLQEQFPEMVIETIHPAELDSTGQEIHPAVPFKAVNTTGLTAVLVAAFQEEHHATTEALTEQRSELDELRALVAEQRARLDAFEAILGNCCAHPDGSRMIEQRNGAVSDPIEDNGSDKLRIVPNPFNEHATVSFTIEQAGRTQLIVNSSDGKDLTVLQDAALQAGDHRYDWNTTAIEPGMYYVTLLVDGKPVVKKAVKVAR